MTNIGFFGKLKAYFKNSDVLMQFIYINIGVFVMVSIAGLICKNGFDVENKDLFNYLNENLFVYLNLPSSFAYFIKKPWTIITYSFLHFDFWHILFNMLLLYWFGRIFLRVFNGRQLGGLYVMGGFFGGLLYIAAFGVFSYHTGFSLSNHPLVGASASVFAIMVAPAIVVPNYSLRLFLFGNVRLKYITIIAVALIVFRDLAALKTETDLGVLAHLGGGLTGVCFALAYIRSIDITSPVNNAIDKLINLFKTGNGEKVSYENRSEQTRRETDLEYNARKRSEEEEIDRILDKLKKSGYESLSSDEKKHLFNAGK